MSAFQQEIVDLSMWTVAVAGLSVCAGAKIGSKLQRWINGDEKLKAEDAYNFGLEDGREATLKELFETSTTEDPQYCGVCRWGKEPCERHSPDSSQREQLFKSEQF